MALGKKTGGRTKGVPNKATADREKRVTEGGITPLDYMLEIMRDVENPKDVRLDAAKSAAPYVHPKLAAIEHTGDMHVWMHEEALGELE